jgi:hypothetical protein
MRLRVKIDTSQFLQDKADVFIVPLCVQGNAMQREPNRFSIVQISSVDIIRLSKVFRGIDLVYRPARSWSQDNWMAATSVDRKLRR